MADTILGSLDAGSTNTEEIEQINNSADDTTTTEGTSVLDELYGIVDSTVVKSNLKDPIVVLDPADWLTDNLIAKRLVEYNPTSNFQPQGMVDSTKVDGISVPVIWLNNLVLEENQILSMILTYDDILPRLTLYVRDDDNLIKLKDSPGARNSVNIVMTYPIDYIYKKISLEFYIDSVDMQNNNTVLVYSCTLACKELQEDLSYTICEEASTTYEFLKEIAEYTGFGFQCTPGCADILDKETRILHGESYLDAIIKYKEKGGLDSNSIFDIWIDLYNNIVLTNVADVFTDDPNSDQLTIYAAYGIQPSNSQMPDKQVKKVRRCLTNFRSGNMGMTNLYFDNEKYENPVITTDTNTIQDIGTVVTLEWFTQRGINGSNEYHREDLEMIEESPDGMENYDYQYCKNISLGVDTSTSGEMLKQEYVTKMFFAKQRINKYIVTLNECNFGLQRGTLIDIVYFAYDTQRSVVLNSADNVMTPNPNNTSDNNTSVSVETKYDVLKNSGTPVIEPTKISGRYYIDGMEIRYDYGNARFIQTLILLKLGVKTNYASITGPALFDIDPNTTFATKAADNSSSIAT